MNVNLVDDTLLFALCFFFLLVLGVGDVVDTPDMGAINNKDVRYGLSLDNKVGAVKINADQNGC